jgi:hypothetical protein
MHILALGSIYTSLHFTSSRSQFHCSRRVSIPLFLILAVRLLLAKPPLDSTYLQVYVVPKSTLISAARVLMPSGIDIEMRLYALETPLDLYESISATFALLPSRYDTCDQ